MVDRSKHGGGYRVRGGTGRYVASTVDNLAGGDEQEANAARIVACVNALDGIEDPEAFVKAAIKIHGFAASHTGNGCLTDTESRWAYRGGESPGALAMWVDQLRAALGGER